MKKLDFAAMREEIEKKEELYNGLTFVYKTLIRECEYQFTTTEKAREEREKANNEDIPRDNEFTDYEIPEFGLWSDERGKYEAIKACLTFIEKEIGKLA